METASGMSLKMMLIPFLYSIVFTSFRIWNAYCFYIVVNRYGFFFLLAISDILVSRVADDEQYFIWCDITLWTLFTFLDFSEAELS